MATKSKTVDPNAGKKRYIALRRIATKKGDEAWNVGAEILLDDLSASRHLAKGNIMPADETTPPAAAPPPVKINEARGATDGIAISAAA